MQIIGLAGQPLSGKDTAAHYIASRGFTHFSAGDSIRQDMRQIGLPLDRNSMRKFSAQKRQEAGMHYPINKICPLITGNAIISGFRNTAEVEYARGFFKDDFMLLALTVPIEVRYERAQSRLREGDAISFEEFKRQEDQERQGNSSHELDKVLAMADYTIDNSENSRQGLYEKIDHFLNALAS